MGKERYCFSVSVGILHSCPVVYNQSQRASNWLLLHVTA